MPSPKIDPNEAADLAVRAARDVFTVEAVARLAAGAQADVKVLNRLRKAEATTDTRKWAKTLHEALDLVRPTPEERRAEAEAAGRL